MNVFLRFTIAPHLRFGWKTFKNKLINLGKLQGWCFNEFGLVYLISLENAFRLPDENSILNKNAAFFLPLKGIDGSMCRKAFNGSNKSSMVQSVGKFLMAVTSKFWMLNSSWDVTISNCSEKSSRNVFIVRENSYAH